MNVNHTKENNRIIVFMGDDREPITDLEAFRDARRAGVKQRIQEAAIACKNAAELSRRSGIPDGTIRKWLKGVTEPTATQLMALAYASGLHPHWLLTGIEPKRPGATSDTDSEFAYINNLKVEAAAGDGSAVDSELVNERMAFRKDWLRRHGLQPEHLCFITARGDSMEPTIRTGDTLLVSEYFYNAGSPDKQQLVHGLEPGKRSGKEGIFVLRMDGGLVVKRLQPDLEGGYIVHSDNPDYSPQKARADDLVIVGRVEWIGRRV